MDTVTNLCGVPLVGLSVDCSEWVKAGLISHEDMLDRNWAYWTTFSADVCWFIFVGRDFSVSLPSGLQAIPVPFVDSGFDNLPWSYPSSNLTPQPNNLSRTFAATCELLIIARRITEFLNSLTNPVTGQSTTLGLVSRIDLELQEWKERLLPEIDITPSNRHTALPHRIMLHLAYWWLIILLHRPFYRRAHLAYRGEHGIDHVKLCTRATDNIMELLSTWRTLYTLRYIPITLVQVIFSAGTIFVLSAAHAISGSRLAHVTLVRSISHAELCIQYLKETGESWACANHAKDILKNLLHEQVGTDIFLQSIHNTTPTLILQADAASPTFGPEDINTILLGNTDYLSASAEDILSFASESPSDRPDDHSRSSNMLVRHTSVHMDFSVQSQRTRDQMDLYLIDSGDQFRVPAPDITRPYGVDEDSFGQTYAFLQEHHFTEDQAASLIGLLDEQQHFR